jgi:hypothetical protein
MEGDWLGAIAERFLGTFDQYPAIGAANTDLIPAVGGPHGPDHIEPGWRLTLPAGARDRGPREHATGPRSTQSPAQPADPLPGAPNTTASSGPATSAPIPAPTVPPSAVSPSAGPALNGSAPTAPSSKTGYRFRAESFPVASPTAARGTIASPANSPEPEAHAAPEAGVSVEGGWMSLPLAAALVAVAALVWLGRRYRYKFTEPFHHEPYPDDFDPDDSYSNDPDSAEDEWADESAPDESDDDLRPMPAVISRLRRAVRAYAAGLDPEDLDQDLDQDQDVDQPAYDDGGVLTAGPQAPDRGIAVTVQAGRQVPAGEFALPPVGPSGTDLAGLPYLPPEGLGLSGPGANDAARALLIAALSAGGPQDPDASGRLVTTVATLNTLIGSQTLEAADIPRLTVAVDLDEALSVIDEQILERRRLLDEYDATDPSALREHHPWSPPMAPILLLAEAPAPTGRARLSTSLHLGAPLQIHAVLLGHWPRGVTLSVRADGHTQPTGPDTATTPPGRHTHAPDHDTPIEADNPHSRPGRVAVLDQQATSQLLQILTEAHTGQAGRTHPDSPHQTRPTREDLPPGGRRGERIIRAPGSSPAHALALGTRPGRDAGTGSAATRTRPDTFGPCHRGQPQRPDRPGSASQSYASTSRGRTSGCFRGSGEGQPVRAAAGQRSRRHPDQRTTTERHSTPGILDHPARRRAAARDHGSPVARGDLPQGCGAPVHRDGEPSPGGP